MKTVWINGTELPYGKAADRCNVSDKVIRYHVKKTVDKEMESFVVNGRVVHLNDPGIAPHPGLVATETSPFLRQLKIMNEKYTELLERLDDAEDEIKVLQKELER